MFRRTLSANLALQIIIATLVLAIIFSTINTFYEFTAFKNNIYQSVNQLLLSTEETASEAIYKLDESIAQTLVDGVVANKYVIKSTLYDENRKVLATKYEPAPEDVWRPLNLKNVTIVTDIEVLNQDAIGSHEIEIDMENSLADFYVIVVNSILIKFIEIIAIALTVYLISVKLVARPVESLARIIANIPPGGKAPEIELTKQEDELGSLARSTVNYINESNNFARELESKQLERLELEAKLRHSQKMDAIGQLAGGIAHDFNNIMTVVLGNTSLAKNFLETKNIDKISTSLTAIEDSALRAAKLTKQLLVFSRKDVITPAIIDMQESVQAASKLIERLVPETIQLVYNLNKVNLVTIDKSQVELILMNLVVNARDASVDGGNIVIECSNKTLDEHFVAEYAHARIGDYVLLTVSDFGTGISEVELLRIFEPFYTTKEVGKGTGLGLSTVYSIVDKWNGFIIVESQLGVGTSFNVYLPESKGSKITETKVIEKKPVDISNLSGTVLVCEDDDNVRELTVALLSSTDLVIHQAADPIKALELCEEINGEFDLLLTDVIMPRMNGKELSDALSKLYTFKTVYVSGYSAEVIADKGVLDEDIWFIKKPFTKEELFEVLSRALNK
ncbi:MAG: signal transduction histidine kinase/CheY-like chemotaxis protein [Enterobacterales bacterium]|jgi:signal transduction histidine kinase/CheY-like chemotaxis protein